MATTPTAPEAAPQAEISALGRITGALFNPGATFADIARKPGWIAPLIVLILISVPLNIIFARRVDWLEYSRNRLEKIPAAARQLDQLPQDQREAALQKGALSEQKGRYYRGCWVPPLILLFFGSVYFGVFKLFGSTANYKTAIAITSYSFLPYALRELVAIPVNLLKDPSAIDPDNFLASNLAAFLPGDAKLWHIVLASPFDIFAIWGLVLLAIGFAAASPKKMSFGKALAIAIGITVFFTLIGTGLATLAG